jgi:hypothetical protein
VIPAVFIALGVVSRGGTKDLVLPYITSVQCTEPLFPTSCCDGKAVEHFSRCNFMGTNMSSLVSTAAGLMLIAKVSTRSRYGGKAVVVVNPRTDLRN